jgi:hypothetical protein
VLLRSRQRVISINLQVVYLLVAMREPLHCSSICRVVPETILSAHAVAFEPEVYHYP